MKYQERPSWCGVAALQNCAKVYDLALDQKRLAHIAGTTYEDGTPPEGIVKAAKTFGLSCVEFETDSRFMAAQWLDARKYSGEPAILCVDTWDHWVALIGGCGDKYCVVDSTNEDWNYDENGVHLYSLQDILCRWCNEDETRGYYGLCIKRENYEKYLGRGCKF